MLTQIKNARFYLQAKLGQRGAEMVEYAIVLACVAAVGVYFYSASGASSNSLKSILDNLWSSISGNATSAGTSPTAPTPPTPPAGGGNGGQQ